MDDLFLLLLGLFLMGVWLIAGALLLSWLVRRSSRQ